MKNKEGLVSKLTKAEYARIHALSAPMPRWFADQWEKDNGETYDPRFWTEALSPNGNRLVKILSKKGLDQRFSDWLDYCVEQALGE